MTLPSTVEPCLSTFAWSRHGSGSAFLRESEIFLPFSSIRSTSTGSTSPTLTTSEDFSTRSKASSRIGISPSTPPRSTNAPNAASRTTVPSRTWPTANERSSSVRFERRSSSAARRCETTIRRRAGSMSITLSGTFVLTSVSIAVPIATRTCEAGRNPRIPPTSTSNPPFTAVVTVPIITSPLSRAARTRSHASWARFRRSSFAGFGAGGAFGAAWAGSADGAGSDASAVAATASAATTSVTGGSAATGSATTGSAAGGSATTGAAATGSGAGGSATTGGSAATGSAADGSAAGGSAAAGSAAGGSTATGASALA